MENKKNNVIKFPGNKTVMKKEPGTPTEIIDIKDAEKVLAGDTKRKFAKNATGTEEGTGPPEPEERTVMIQAMVMTPHGPLPITQILMGLKPLDENDVKSKMADKKTNIILADDKGQQNDITTLIEILVKDYGYLPVPIDYTFNFIPKMSVGPPPGSGIIT